MRKLYLLIIGLYLLVYIAPLAFRPMVIPDESRYAEIPREMIASGDWIAPKLDGIRYFEKPVLGYWLNATSMLVFGDNLFAIRFPSALAAGLAALLLFVLLRRQALDERTALMSPVIFLTFVEVFASGVFSVLDSMFSFFLTATLVALYLATEESNRKLQAFFYALSGAAAGCAFMTKGFLAFALPGVAVLPYVLWDRKFLSVLKNAWISIMALLLVVLPWALLVHMKEPDYWNYFFWVEHVQRFSSKVAQHGKPFWFYLPVLLLGGLPWTFTFPSFFRKENRIVNTSLSKFAVCWLVLPFVLLSVARGKLQTYILPCFAPLAVLLALTFEKKLSEDKDRAWNIGLAALGAVLACVALFLPINHSFSLIRHTIYDGTETLKVWLAFVGLASWGCLSLYASRLSSTPRKFAFCALSPVIFFFTVQFAVPEHLKGGHTPLYFFEEHASEIPLDALVVSNERLVHAVCWYLKRADVNLLGKKGELAYGLSHEPSRIFNVNELAELIDRPRKQPVVLLLHTKTYLDFEKSLPVPKKIVSDSNFTMAMYP